MFTGFWYQNGSKNASKIAPKIDLRAQVTLGCILVTFWFPFGALCLTFGVLWLPFGAPWLAFGSLWLLFGALWFPFGTLWLHINSFWLRLAPFWLHFATFSLLWLSFCTLFPPFSSLFLLLRFAVDVPFLIYKAQHARPVVACDVDPPAPFHGARGVSDQTQTSADSKSLFRTPPCPPTRPGSSHFADPCASNVRFLALFLHIENSLKIRRFKKHPKISKSDPQAPQCRF